MMNVGVIKIAMLATVVMVTHGLICQFPHCSDIKCEPVDEDKCNGTVRMGGGYCGCCIACFTTLGQGEICEDKDPIDALFYPPTALCDKGLYCEHNSSTCEHIAGYEYHFG